jgi:hypothetical protein
MKSTKRIKVKNGIEYWYEETPYYDKEKKQIRHKSKYLGRNVDGQPVKMRSASDEIKEMVKRNRFPLSPRLITVLYLSFNQLWRSL